MSLKSAFKIATAQKLLSELNGERPTNYEPWWSLVMRIQKRSILFELKTGRYFEPCGDSVTDTYIFTSIDECIEGMRLLTKGESLRNKAG